MAFLLVFIRTATAKIVRTFLNAENIAVTAFPFFLLPSSFFLLPSAIIATFSYGNCGSIFSITSAL
jgi:hypothetical protein